MEWDAYLILKVGGIAVFIFGGSWMASKCGFSLAKSLFVTASAALIGSCFSRFWYIVQHYFGREPYEMGNFVEAWGDSGSVLYGWVLGGTLVIWILCRILRWNPVRFLDSVLPWLLVAQILNRFGCFDAECCWGAPTDLLISVWNSNAQARVHPVQLYEAAFDAFLILLIWRRGKKQGQTTFIYFFGYALGRFFLEFLRGDNQPALFFMTVPQVTSILILLVVFRLKNRIVVL